MDGKYLKVAFKAFLILVVIALIVQAVAFGIYWWNRRNFGERGKLKVERDKCERVVNGEEGDLAELSYCKRFLEWFDTNKNIDGE